MAQMVRELRAKLEGGGRGGSWSWSDRWRRSEVERGGETDYEVRIQALISAAPGTPVETTAEGRWGTKRR